MFIKYLVKFYLNIKFHDTINDPLPVLPGNEQDLSHKNMVSTYLFYQVCKVSQLNFYFDLVMMQLSSRQQF